MFFLLFLVSIFLLKERKNVFCLMDGIDTDKICLPTRNPSIMEIMDVESVKITLEIPENIRYIELENFIESQIGKKVVIMVYTEDVVKAQIALEQRLDLHQKSGACEAQTGESS